MRGAVLAAPLNVEKTMSKTVYVTHPVSPERKHELREQGCTIVDAVYAPEGEDVLDGGASGEAEESTPRRGGKKKAEG